MQVEIKATDEKTRMILTAESREEAALLRSIPDDCEVVNANVNKYRNADGDTQTQATFSIADAPPAPAA